MSPLPLYYYRKKLSYGVSFEPGVESTLNKQNIHFHQHKGYGSPHPFFIPRWPNWPGSRKIRAHAFAAIALVHGELKLDNALREAKGGSPEFLLSLLENLSRVSAPIPLDYRNENIHAFALSLPGVETEVNDGG